MGLTRPEHDDALALAITELAEACGLPADDEKYPGSTALRRLAAERRAAQQYERDEHLRIAERQASDYAFAKAHSDAEIERAKSTLNEMAMRGIRRIGGKPL